MTVSSLCRSIPKEARSLSQKSKSTWNGSPPSMCSKVGVALADEKNAYGLDPPPGYMSAPVDLLAGLDEIHANATKAQYKSQFEFDNAIEALFASAHDRHLRITPCSHSTLGFKVNLPLVSVSTDGLELPKIYTLSKPPDKVSEYVTDRTR